jgi:hypothetical protein
MRRRRFPLALFVVLVLAILGSAVLAAPALAKGHKSHKKATHISGEIVLNPADNVSQPPVQQGAISVITAEARVTFTGDMRGPAVEPYTSVVMPDDGPILQFSRGSVFTGKVLGRRGTLEYNFSGDAEYGGLITITGGTGRLAGATGRIGYFPTSDATADPLTFGYEGLIRLRTH